MREIKFRAWNEHKREMAFGPAGDAVSPSWVLAMCSANKLDPMQYTGLKDRNNMEIYEGDIVQGKTDLFDKMTGQVVFAGTGYVIDGVGKYKRIREELYNYYEVIGNIYEHPHLLKEANTHVQDT